MAAEFDVIDRLNLYDLRQLAIGARIAQDNVGTPRSEWIVTAAMLARAKERIAALEALEPPKGKHTSNDNPDIKMVLDHDADVAREVERLRVRREAQRTIDADRAEDIELPDFLTLGARLVLPRPATRWRIQGFQPQGTRVLATAKAKTGKTTLTTNLVRSLVDGDPFLGQAHVTPSVGRVAIIDAEMNPAQLDEWFRAQRITRAFLTCT
jgi:hypothetical protein